MLKIGFIGCGGIAREYLSRLDALSEQIQVSAFCDLDLARATGFCARRFNPAFYPPA